jgi:hypothetical protein
MSLDPLNSPRHDRTYSSRLSLVPRPVTIARVLMVGQVALGTVGWLTLLGTFILVKSANVPLNIGLVAFALSVGLALTISYLILWNITRQIHTSALWWFLLAAEAAAIAGDVSTIVAIPDPDRFVGVFTVIDVYLTHGLLPVVVIVLLLLRPSRNWFRGGNQPGGMAVD